MQLPLRRPGRAGLEATKGHRGRVAPRHGLERGLLPAGRRTPAADICAVLGEGIVVLALGSIRVQRHQVHVRAVLLGRRADEHFVPGAAAAVTQHLDRWCVIGVIAHFDGEFFAAVAISGRAGEFRTTGKSPVGSRHGAACKDEACFGQLAERTRGRAASGWRGDTERECLFGCNVCSVRLMATAHLACLTSGWRYRECL